MITRKEELAIAISKASKNFVKRALTEKNGDFDRIKEYKIHELFDLVCLISAHKEFFEDIGEANFDYNGFFENPLNEKFREDVKHLTYLYSLSLINYINNKDFEANRFFENAFSFLLDKKITDKEEVLYIKKLLFATLFIGILKQCLNHIQKM